MPIIADMADVIKAEMNKTIISIPIRISIFFI